MLYLGHFSFIEHDDGEFNHGIFTVVVTACDIDNATVKFHSLMEQRRNDMDLFEKQTFIFLEDIIEIRDIPKEGFIAHHVHYEGTPPLSVSRSLPGVSETLCEAYRPYPEFESVDGREEIDIVPFMTINR